ncbi:MAG: GDP-mannose-dependent alpha-(1-6)-phosphatidylinositol monomannoside mannosyltransferase [candidate division BRC1 bacterium ADurb.BinA364]|nr:MAG: GDP-mannose-dependent alpha-(1-6)-phosphatidylinositol monomannoside mannosyltransferase [candidate division BRC1 bacterium ADurb.BinA364]
MRILYLCADPGVPILGRKGCSTHVREICRALDRAGHAVRIVCSNRGEDLANTENLDIVEVPALSSRKIGFDFRLLFYNPRFGREIARQAALFQPDAIYERFSLYSLAGANLARRIGAPRLLEVNAFLSVEQNEKLHFPWLANWIDRRIVRQAAHVVVVSEPLREEVARLGISRSNIHKMPMAANIQHFTPEKSGDCVRRAHGLDGKYVIGYVGTLTGWHGINLLYDVAERMRREYDNFAFFLVGGDPEKVEMHRAKARRLGLGAHFVFAGSVPYEDVPEHIRAMDVTLVPDTTYWSSPTKLFEYQASGTPTVAPRYAAIVEAMTDGKEGLFFEPRNVEQFAARLLELARDPARRIKMGLNARRRVLSSHSIDDQVARIIEIFEIIRRRRVDD